MNKRANKPKTGHAEQRVAGRMQSKANAAVEAVKNSAVSGNADPHDPLLVLVRHTYAHRVCHPHVV